MPLPTLDAQDRPAHARRIHSAVLQQVSDDTPVRTLGRALQLYRLNPPTQLGPMLEDEGYLLDVAVTQVVSGLWPDLAAYQGGHYDPNDPTAKHSFSFRQRMSSYLRDTVNMLCLRTGNRHQTSRWWVRAEWFQRDPLHFVITKFGEEVPDVPEAELIRLREQNDRLRQDNDRLRKDNDRLRATLLTITE